MNGFFVSGDYLIPLSTHDLPAQIKRFYRRLDESLDLESVELEDMRAIRTVYYVALEPSSVLSQPGESVRWQGW